MSKGSSIIYLAWQDLETRRWFPVGRLRRLPDGLYEFVYIRGYEEAQALAGMQPLLGFTNTTQRYLSEALFPHFQNRLMSPSREEYATYLERLGLKDEPHEPLAILARSGGHRKTDSFMVFEAPIELEAPQGQRFYSIRFFIHGARYIRPEIQSEALESMQRQRLCLLQDWQNPKDPDAIMLRTEDNQLLGWMPRYYCADVLALKDRQVPIDVTIEQVNEPSTPAYLRVLCLLTARWPDDFRSLSSRQYAPLAGGEDQVR